MKAVFMAILAAILYGISAPISKLLLAQLPSTLMAALLYLGAGCGMLVVNVMHRIRHKERTEAEITSKEIPYVISMILLDIVAPILLMLGLKLTTSANAALLNNFEIVATSLIALMIFKEAIGKRMWLAIILITISSAVLSLEGLSSMSFSPGSFLILLACVCWGFENNCTRKLSMKDPRQIVVIKGIGSGSGALLLSLLSRQFSQNIQYIIYALLLGFIAYGLSIYYYVLAQRELGAARTSAYYAAAPFIGVVSSWIIFHEGITSTFLIALCIMILGTFLAATEIHKHLHLHTNVTHEHKHNHIDGHHLHHHDEGFTGEHCHVHTHEEIIHTHKHTPDLHHTHEHTHTQE
jgi:drug/metabolite transporter (DMT)-like permease